MVLLQAIADLPDEALRLLRFTAAAQEVFDAWRAALGRKPALYSVGHCRRLWEVYSAVTITSHLFGAYLKCSTKCFFRLLGEAAAETGNAYANWVQTQTEAYHSEGLKRLMEGVPRDERAIRPSGTGHLKTANWRLAGEFVAPSENLESNIHAIERIPSEGRGQPTQFIPIRFVFTNKLTRDDKLLLAFDALTLSKILDHDVGLGKIIHGDDQATLKVKTSALVVEIRKLSGKIATLLSSSARSRSESALCRMRVSSPVPTESDRER